MASKNIDGTHLTELFRTAHEEGTLSAESLQSLSIVDIGAEIQAGLGTSVDDVTASEVLLVTLLIDDSGSIQYGQNAQIVRDGHNLVLRALMESKQNHSVLAHTTYLNGTVIFPYVPLAVVDEREKKKTGRIAYVRNPLAVELDHANYDPRLGTPLYDQTLVTLGRVVAKTQEFSDAGVAARSITLIITDGADAHSTKATADAVRTVVEDLIAENHIVAAMGISDGDRTDFRSVFHKMGIPDRWILLPGDTQSEIRKAFQVFSQSAVRLSQGTVASRAAGGFGAP